MENEELIKLREEYANKETHYARKKRKFVILTSTFYIFATLLFIIGVCINKDTRPFVTSFVVLSFIALGLFILGSIALGFLLYNHINEKINEKKRDQVSYQLTGNALKKYN